MTNQEAAKILGQYDVSDIHFYTTDGKEIPFDKWSDAIEMAIKALEAQKWIPCSERLPDSKEYVLVTDYGETNIGRRFCDRWWLDYCGDKMKDVTAWMPLPEPYRAERRTDAETEV